MSRLAAAVLLALGTAGPASAQFLPGYGTGYGYNARAGFGYSFGSRGYGYSFGASYRYSYAVRAYSPYLYTPYPYAPLYPYGLYAGYPAWGYAAPSVVVINNNPPPVIADPDPEPRPKAKPNPNDFVAVRPAKAAPKLVVPPQPAPAPAPLPAPLPGPDPRQEAVRHAAAGLEAAAAEEYGRSAERFAAAVKADPTDSRSFFRLAQVRMARGEYAEAVAAIRDGLKLAPDWPAAPFDPRELYGFRADRYALHLAELKRAYADTPGDPTLGFLLGYQLWFTAEKAEAVKLFRKVAPRVTDAGAVERFLRAAGG